MIVVGDVNSTLACALVASKMYVPIAHFKVPCITIRENTERPITVTEGTNVIVGTDSDRILQESKAIINGNGKIGGVPKFWDDGVSGRIVEVVGSKLS